MNDLAFRHVQDNTRRGESIRGLALLLIGSLSFLYVSVIGQLYLVEAILAIWLAIRMSDQNFRRDRPMRDKRMSWILTLGGIWIYATVLSDLLNGSGGSNSFKAVAAIFFTLTCLVSIERLVSYEERALIVLALGYVLSRAIQYVIQPTTYQHDLPWKFGFAVPVTITAAILVGRRQGMAPTIFILLSALNLLLSFRSQALICAAVALLLMTARWKFSPAKVLCVLALGAGLATVVSIVYSDLVSSGDLGFAALQKYELQSEGEFGVIAGGRPEIFYVLAALQDSFFFGQGSSSELTQQLSDSATSTMLNAGYNQLAAHATAIGSAVPTHSFLFGSWVASGLGGAAFWLVVGAISLNSVLRSASSTHLRSTPLIVYLSVSLCWDITYSPFGTDRRFSVPLTIIAIFTHERLLRTAAKGSATVRMRHE